MPRVRKLRDDLEENGILLDEHGIEIGRLTLNDNLILDPLAVFVEIERMASHNYGRVRLTYLYRKFGRYGTWGYDPAVQTLLMEMQKQHLITITGGSVAPAATLQRVAKVTPPYVTRQQALAGLEPLDNAE